MPRQRGYSPQTCETYAISFKLLLELPRSGPGLGRPGCRSNSSTRRSSSTSWRTSSRSVGTARYPQPAARRHQAFMRYVEHHVPSALAQVGQIDAIPVKRCDQKLIRHLTMEEVRSILNAPDLTTRAGMRDRAMMHLCFAGGLRVSELISVLLENVALGQMPSVMVRGKGRKERCLPLWKETARDIRAWLSVRGAIRTPELFANAQGTAMTRAGFEYVLDKHVRAAAKTCPTLDWPHRCSASASA